MKLSSRSQFAITAMLELALKNKTHPVTLFEISRTQQISLSYLEQLFARLRRQGLVIGRRGPGGGYVLSRPATQITMADIITAVDGDHGMASGGRSGGEAGMSPVTCELLWEKLSDAIEKFLGSITLKDLVAMSREGSHSGSQAARRAQSDGPSAELRAAYLTHL